MIARMIISQDLEPGTKVIIDYSGEELTVVLELSKK
jgi:hypothetical protein